MGWVKGCLNHRGWTMAAVLVFVIGSFSLVPYLPTGFLPPDDLSQTQVTLTLAPGSTFKDTFALAERARLDVQKNKYVKMVYTAIGGGSAGSDPFAGPSGSNVRTATLTLNMTHRSQRPGVSKQQIEAQLRDALALIDSIRPHATGTHRAAAH